MGAHGKSDLSIEGGEYIAWRTLEAQECSQGYSISHINFTRRVATRKDGGNSDHQGEMTEPDAKLQIGMQQGQHIHIIKIPPTLRNRYTCVKVQIYTCVWT